MAAASVTEDLEHKENTVTRQASISQNLLSCRTWPGSNMIDINNDTVMSGVIFSEVLWK